MISRRRLIIGGAAAVAGGAAVGVVGSQMLAPVSSLRAIGAGKSMLVLLDTDIERALLVLGEPNDGLLENAVGISTVGNKRIDVLIATHQILASRAARQWLPIESAHTICLQNDLTLAPIQGVDTILMDHGSLNLGDRMSISIWIDQSVRKVDALNRPSFSVGVARGNVSAVLLGNTNAQMLPSHPSPDVLVLPDSGDATLARKLFPSLLVCTEGRRDISVDQMEVFWDDPVRVELGTKQISYRRDQLWS